jgi:hypothetical protein
VRVVNSEQWIGHDWRKVPDRLVDNLRPGPEVVVSSPLPARILVQTGSNGVETVSSDAGPAVVLTGDWAAPVIGDQELFSLLAGRPAMIVRPVGEPARLFLPGEPADSPFRVN